MGQPDLSDYVQVHERVGQFWEKYPDGRIETTVEFPDDNTVRCQARVFRATPDPWPLATGHAEERRDQGFVNKTSAVENAETSAVGRALAVAGFSIHKGIASREEVQAAIESRNGGEAVRRAENASQGIPATYLDALRVAIRHKDPKELSDDDEFARLVGTATTEDEKKAVTAELEAALLNLDGDPVRVRARWEELTGANG